jgi:hypothetical protein
VPKILQPEKKIVQEIRRRKVRRNCRVASRTAQISSGDPGDSSVTPWILFATFGGIMDGKCIYCSDRSAGTTTMTVSWIPLPSFYWFFMCSFSFSCCQYLVLVGKRNLTAPSLGVRLGDPSLRPRIGLFWLISGMAMRGYLII